jgi:hypothetical protein
MARGSADGLHWSYRRPPDLNTHGPFSWSIVGGVQRGCDGDEPEGAIKLD